MAQSIKTDSELLEEYREFFRTFAYRTEDGKIRIDSDSVEMSSDIIFEQIPELKDMPFHEFD